MMRRVRNKDTTPELYVRRLLHARGFRFRLHRRDLPGSPDIVLPAARTAIFVHGCFWHGHDCPRGRPPASNQAFWTPKLEANRRRDRAAVAALTAQGWQVEVLWQCTLKQSTEELVSRLETSRAPQRTAIEETR